VTHVPHFGHTAQRKNDAARSGRQKSKNLPDHNRGEHRRQRHAPGLEPEEQREAWQARKIVAATQHPSQPSPFSKCENTQKSHRCILEMVVSWGSLEQFVELKLCRCVAHTSILLAHGIQEASSSTTRRPGFPRAGPCTPQCGPAHTSCGPQALGRPSNASTSTCGTNPLASRPTHTCRHP
jgi:hypothetical protein